MRKSKWAVLSLSLTTALAGCATANIKPNDLNALGAAPTAEEVTKVAHGAPLYRLDYLADGHAYIYETYEASDTGRYYGLLFQDGKLAAVDVMGQRDAYWPGLRACTIFPPAPDLDVDGCFRGFNQSVQAAAVKVVSDIAPDKAAQSRNSSDTTETVVEGTVYMALAAPIVLPAMAIMLPLMGAAAAGDESRRDALKVKLGDDYADIRAGVEQYPEKYRSITDGNGTVLVPGAVVPNAAAAFGVEKGKVVWIDLSPATECSGGFMYRGMTCKLGDRPRPHVAEQPTRAVTAPVIDEWENLAIYYSAPPSYEVISPVAGQGSGFTAKGRMEDAVEDMKKRARKMGATGVLLGVSRDDWAHPPVQAPPPSTGSPVYAADSPVPMDGQWLLGFAIYVPADAAAFQKAASLHASNCDALSQQNDAADDAYDAAKDAGKADDIAAAEAKGHAVEAAEDAAFCGDDDWYAEQMAAQKH